MLFVTRRCLIRHQEGNRGSLLSRGGGGKAHGDRRRGHKQIPIIHSLLLRVIKTCRAAGNHDHGPSDRCRRQQSPPPHNGATSPSRLETSSCAPEVSVRFIDCTSLLNR